MTWEPCGLWSIKSGDWTISKSFVRGVACYTLWHGNDRIGVFDTSVEAKDVASATEAQKNRQ